MTSQELTEIKGLIADIVSDLGTVVHHSGEALSAHRDRWDAQVAEESKYALECAENAADLVHQLVCRLTPIAKRAKAKAKKGGA